MFTGPADLGAVAASLREAVHDELQDMTDRIVAAIATSNENVLEKLDRLLEALERFARGVTGA